MSLPTQAYHYNNGKRICGDRLERLGHVWPFESAFHIDRLRCDGIHGGWPLRGVGFLLRYAPTLYIIRHLGRGGSGIVLRYCEVSAVVEFGMSGEGGPPGRGVLPHC